MFYSPFDVCDVCKQYVLLDQTQADCSREHHCQVAHCPLQRFFAEPNAGLTHACEDDAKETVE
jgi:hypothetical protein